MVNEASANREVVFYGSDVVNEYAVCEGDELSYCVGDRAVECVVRFDVFDQAVGASRKVYGAQKEEQKCFHDEIREQEKAVMSASADSVGGVPGREEE